MTFSDLNWHIAGVGRCDGDSVPDIIWRNYSTGADMIWYMYQNGALRESKSITGVTDPGWTIVNGADVGLVTLAPAPGSDSDPSRDEAQTPLDSKEKIKEIDLEDCGPVASVESPFKLTMAEKGSNQAFPGSAEADPLVGQGFFLAEPAASARGPNAFQVGPHRPETLNLVMAAQTTYYVYGFDGKLLAEYDQAGNCMKDYLYVGSKLVAEYQPASGKYYYYMSDQVNSTRMVTDDVGTVVHSVTYDPYGGPQKTWIKTYEPKLKFSGKEREIASELDYFGARYYDHIGYRFVSVDPIINKEEAIANPQKWNLYSYCDNNPITYFDPDGQSIWGSIERFGIKVGSAIGSGAEWAWDNRQAILETTVGATMMIAGAVGEFGSAGFVAQGNTAAGVLTGEVSTAAVATGYCMFREGLNKFSEDRHSRNENRLEGGGQSKGTPRSNRAQNKQFKSAAKTVERKIGRKLTPKERDEFHDLAHKQNWGYRELVKEGVETFGKR